MANRPVIDIPVNDAAFNDFVARYNKFTEAVKDLPAQWGQVDATVQGTSSTFLEMTAALVNQKLLLNELAKAQRQSTKNEQEALNVEKRRRAEFRGMLEDAKGIAKTVTGITADLFRWVGFSSIISGLVGAGGLWGLDQLANRVSDSRRSAQGLGVTTGQQQALGINYQRYLDVNPDLENIAAAKSDLGKRWAFGAMGVNPDGKDPATLMVEMARRAKQLFDGSNQTQQFAQSRGLLEFFTMDELRRLHSVSMKELTAAEAGYSRDSRDIGLSDDVSRKWQELSVQMGRAGRQIENVFVDGLTPLVPEISELSASVAKSIKTFMQSDALKKLIPELGEGIKWVADYLGSPKFQTDIKNFMADMGDLAGWVHSALVKLGIIGEHWKTDAQGNPVYSDPENAARNHAPLLGDRAEAEQAAASDKAVHDNMNRTAREMAAMRVFIGRGWSKDQAAGIVANLNAESGLNPFSHGDGGAAYGIGQWHKDRQANYARLFGHTIQSVKDPTLALREQLEFVQWELNHTHGLAKSYLKGSWGPEQAGAVVSKYYEAPKDVMGEQHRRAADARVIVQIYNATGAAVAVQGAQVAH